MNKIKYLKNPLLIGSALLFLGSTIGNVGGYFYHLTMGRLLGPENYGTLVSLISLLYVASIVTLTLSTIFAKFTSQLKVGQGNQQIGDMFYYFFKKLLILAIGFSLLFFLCSNYISDFLNIENMPVFMIILAASFLIRFLSPLNLGIIQGLQKFSFLSFFSVLAAALKLGVGYFLVKAGYSYIGAIFGIIIADLMTYFFSLLPLKFIFHHHQQKSPFILKDAFSYGFPALLTVAGLTSLYTTDVILVKHYFSSYEAGLYSALGMMGKIIFFASSAITTAMFPISAEKYAQKKDHKKVIVQALWLTSLISLSLLIIYILLPQASIKLIYGEAFLGASPYLIRFGLFIFLYALVSLLANYFLSIGKKEAGYLVIIGAVVQLFLISVFHQSIGAVIWCSTGVVSLLIFGLLLFYKRNG